MNKRMSSSEEVLEWPKSQLGLNPTENLWGDLKRAVGRRYNLTDLEVLLQGRVDEDSQRKMCQADRLLPQMTECCHKHEKVLPQSISLRVCIFRRLCYSSLYCYFPLKDFCLFLIVQLICYIKDGKNSKVIYLNLIFFYISKTWHFNKVVKTFCIQCSQEPE